MEEKVEIQPVVVDEVTIKNETGNHADNEADNKSNHSNSSHSDNPEVSSPDEPDSGKINCVEPNDEIDPNTLQKFVYAGQFI